MRVRRYLGIRVESQRGDEACWIISAWFLLFRGDSAHEDGRDLRPSPNGSFQNYSEDFRGASGLCVCLLTRVGRGCTVNAAQ